MCSRFAARGGEALINRRLKSIDIQVEKQRLRAYASLLQDVARHQPVGPRPRRPVRHNAHSSTPAAPSPDRRCRRPRSSMTTRRRPRTGRPASSPPVTVPAPATSTALPNRYQADNQTIEVGISNTFMAGDFDGDGRTDALVALRDRGSTSRAHVRHDRDTAERDAPDERPARVAALGQRNDAVQRAGALGRHRSPPFDGRDKLVKAWVADVNGDGLDDLILLGWIFQSATAPYAGLDLRLNAAFSRGDGTFTLASPQFTPTPWSTAVVWGSKVAYPEDRADLPARRLQRRRPRRLRVHLLGLGQQTLPRRRVFEFERHVHTQHADSDRRRPGNGGHGRPVDDADRKRDSCRTRRGGWRRGMSTTTARPI